MAKTVKTDAEIFEFPAFDASKMNDQFRSFAEKGMEQSKEAYAKAKGMAEDSQKMVQDTFDSAKAHSTDIAMKALKAARSNTDAGFAHFEALLGAKSFSDVIEMQTAFARKQFEIVTDQVKDMQSATKVAAEDIAKPAKVVAEKVAKTVEAA
jgi:phasin